MSDEEKLMGDPLGLDVLGRWIEAVKTDASAFERLSEAYTFTARRYAAMKDRYRQL